MANGGATTWYFPDGYLPEKTDGAMEAHEAVMILNVQDDDAHIRLDIYFEDREPVLDIALTVEARRVVSLHTDIPSHIGDVVIPPLTQYAMRLRSDVPVVAQFGRLDTTQSNMAYYCAPAICEP